MNDHKHDHVHVWTWSLGRFVCRFCYMPMRGASSDG